MDLLDHATAERILSGEVEVDDLPPVYSGVVTLLSALADAPPARATTGQMTIGAMAAAIAALPPYLPPAPGPTERLRSKMVRARVIAVVVFASLVGTTGLAFAGDLGPAQRFASHLFARVGISVPLDHHSQGHAHGNSGSNKGSEISNIAHQSPSPGPGKGQQVCTVASDGKCKAGQHGNGGGQGDGNGQGNGNGNSQGNSGGGDQGGGGSSGGGSSGGGSSGGGSSGGDSQGNNSQGAGGGRSGGGGQG